MGQGRCRGERAFEWSAGQRARRWGSREEEPASGGRRGGRGSRQGESVWGQARPKVRGTFGPGMLRRLARFLGTVCAVRRTWQGRGGRGNGE